MTTREPGKTETRVDEARQHFWILYVTGDPKRWAWRPEATERGGLVIAAFQSRRQATMALYEARMLYGRGHARLVKYVPEVKK